jgi:hypothetical protein
MRSVANSRVLPSGSGPQPSLTPAAPIANVGSQEYAIVLPSGENVGTDSSLSPPEATFSRPEPSVLTTNRFDGHAPW